MENIIEIKNLSKKFRKVLALSDVNLEIKKGELFGLLGINGAGKSTLIKILSCLILPTTGKITISGFDIEKQEKNVKQIINIAPQETSIAPNLTVLENLEFFAKIYYKDNIKIKEKVEELIQQFELKDILNKRSKTLSGGYKRRLSIAISLISEPKILFLDEPTLGLDILTRRALWNIILSLKTKTTIILTTHYLEEIQSLCDRVGILTDGKLRFVGTIEECIKETNETSFENAFIKISQKGGK